MQNNLKSRSVNYSRNMLCVDGKEYSIDSENAEELYVIEGFLKYEGCKNQVSAIGERKIQDAQRENKYGPNNPYPNK